jgi:hypothetical protein
MGFLSSDIYNNKVNRSNYGLLISHMIAATCVYLKKLQRMSIQIEYKQGNQ